MSLPSRGFLRRLDSLFARLLLAQTALALGLALVFGALFYVERNRTVAVLYAERWAPVLASAAGLTPESSAPPAVLRAADGPPAGHRRLGLHAPRMMALREALAARGVPVDEVALGLREAQPIVWLHVVPAGRPAQWLGVRGELVIPRWSQRAVLGLALASLLLVAVSWAFTRWLTQPLEQLRSRMRAHAPGAPPASPSRPLAGARVAPEIGQIDAAFADLQARLAQHERERAVLLAGVSHDLRSPLGRIRMAAELLPDAPGVAPRREAIVRNVQVADRLVESFLDFVRSGELAFDQRVDLAAAVRSVTASFERPAHELSVEAPSSLELVDANPLMVERLLLNLVDNALKHGRPPVRVRVASTASEVSLEVEDAGDGIAPALREQVLDAFVRGDGSRAAPGTGLGLAIVRQVAARLGGSVTIGGEAGRHWVRITVPRRG